MVQLAPQGQLPWIFIYLFIYLFLILCLLFIVEIVIVNFYNEFGQYVPAARVLVMTSQASSRADNDLLGPSFCTELAIEKIYPTFGSGVCVDLLKRSKTCTWISIFGSLWDLYLDGILTNLTYMKFKLQILYWFIARLRGLPLWYFLFGWHAYYFNLHEVCSFKFYSRGRRDTSLGRR